MNDRLTCIWFANEHENERSDRHRCFEKRKTVELVGVGICHNTDQFYRNSIVIKNLEDLGDAMIEKISCLL